VIDDQLAGSVIGIVVDERWLPIELDEFLGGFCVHPL